jgi:polysaccharide deacetylase family protein (PEP-CTERM system associated)
VLSQLDEHAFEEDVVRAKRLLEDGTGAEVIGYRAPRFSTVEYLPRVLRKHGFQYDSSSFPSSVGVEYGGSELDKLSEARGAWRYANGLVEAPIATLNVAGRSLPWGGGGYFRFYPYWVFRWGVKWVLRATGSYLFYAHPWELDPGQPRVKDVRWLDRFLHYSLMSTAESKLNRLIGDFDFVPIRDGLTQLGLL